jgi:spore maturation protein CgeB
MKIMLAGVFNVPWSTGLFMKKHLERLGHQVLQFEIDRAHPAPMGPAGRLSFKIKTSLALRGLEKRLLHMAESLRPEVVVVMKGKNLDPACTRQLSQNSLVAYRYMDAPLHSYVVAHAMASQVTFVTGAHAVEPLASATGKANVFQLFEGCDPDIHKPGAMDGEYSCDIAFAGAPAGDRIELLKACQKAGYKVKIWGQPGWPKGLEYTGKYAYNADFAKVCASAKIVLGVNSCNTCRGYFSDRAFLTLACRGFYLVHYVPGLEDYFVNRRHLVWFKDQTEMLGIINRYLNDLEARTGIAKDGQQLVYQKYTWEKSVNRMLEHMKKLRGEG